MTTLPEAPTSHKSAALGPNPSEGHETPPEGTETRIRPHRVLAVLVDNREKRPLAFPAETRGRQSWRVETFTACLPAGDYSLAGHGGRPGEAFGIAIERKSGWNELAGNLTAHRDRFTRECQRLTLYRTRLIVVEGASRDEPEMGMLRTRADPRALIASIDALSERYQIPVVWTRDREEAAQVILAALRRYVERHLAPGGASRPKDAHGAPATVPAWHLAQLETRIGNLERIAGELLSASLPVAPLPEPLDVA
ncbi:MAG: hypothetical protein PWP23_706 [Candidatus Sumerlaeota bacterium]|nr:hypothetical protein [Candidatus Sumerlaeota bacterium]